MGHGGYSLFDNTFIRTASVNATKTNAELFEQRTLSGAMSPYNVTVRESRDSAEHPNSFPVILGLDTTGSMGSIPNYLVKEGFNAVMDKIIRSGEKDPQILFLGVGDHKTDQAPLQIGQFESNDELLHKWLTQVFLEGNGGGNGGESYLLAWYFAANKTSTDSFEKRGRKGLLFTVGDEPVHRSISARSLKAIFGDGEYSETTAVEALDAARQKYEVFHVHVKETSTGNDQRTIDGWKELMGDHLIIVENSRDVASVIAETISKYKQEGKTDDKLETDEVIL